MAGQISRSPRDYVALDFVGKKTRGCRAWLLLEKLNGCSETRFVFTYGTYSMGMMHERGFMIFWGGGTVVADETVPNAIYWVEYRAILWKGILFGSIRLFSECTVEYSLVNGTALSNIWFFVCFETVNAGQLSCAWNVARACTHPFARIRIAASHTYIYY